MSTQKRLFNPFFLFGPDDTPLSLKLLCELGDIVDVVAEVGDVSVVLASYQLSLFGPASQFCTVEAVGLEVGTDRVSRATTERRSPKLKSRQILP